MLLDPIITFRNRKAIFALNFSGSIIKDVPSYP